MKFLIDAQLPPELCEILATMGFDSVHVNSLPHGDETSDKEISVFADQNELIVVTKDSDFYHSHMILSQPKMLMLITTGNVKNRKLFDLIRDSGLMIKNLFKDCSYVELTSGGLIGHKS